MARRAAGCVLACAITPISRTCEIRVTGYSHQRWRRRRRLLGGAHFSTKMRERRAAAAASECNYTWAATKPSPDCHASCYFLCPDRCRVLYWLNKIAAAAASDMKWIRSYFIFSFGFWFPSEIRESPNYAPNQMWRAWYLFGRAAQPYRRCSLTPHWFLITSWLQCDLWMILVHAMLTGR